MAAKQLTNHAFGVLLAFLILSLASGAAPTVAAHTARAIPNWHHITEYNIPGPGSDPYDITLGPDGNLWFVDKGAGVLGDIGKITPTGQITEYSLPDPTSGPNSITAGPDGNLWFTLYYSNQIGNINPYTHKVTVFNVPHNPAYPDDLTVGPDGNIWFTQLAVNAVGKMTLSGKVTEYPIPPHRNGNCTCGITTGSDGKIWLAEDWSNYIAKIDPSTGKVVEYKVPGPGYPPNITQGPKGDKHMWFTNFSAGQIANIDPATGQITEYNLPDRSSMPLDIVAAENGLWFTENNSSKIGYITLDGKISEYSTPDPGYPSGITQGPEGNFWFVDLLDRIGKVKARP